MKKIYFLLYSLIFLSTCQQAPESSSKLNSEGEEDFSCIVPDSTDLVEQNTDLELGLPDWLETLFPDSLENEYQVIVQDVRSYYPLDDSTAYVLVFRSDLNCGYTDLYTLQNQNLLGSFRLAESCDHDMSYYQYQFKEYKELSANSFEVQVITLTVPDSMQDGKHIKGNADFDDLAIGDTLEQEIQILANGQIAVLEGS